MNLLIVEDDVGLHAQYKWGLEGYNMFFATDYKSAIQGIEDHQPGVVLLDLGLPPDADNASEGLRVLDFITSRLPTTKVIVVTGSEQNEHAQRSIALGAYDFFQKDSDIETIEHAIGRAANVHNIEKQIKLAKANEKIDGSAIIGDSPSMSKTKLMLNKVAPIPVNTLLSGESGTGKELFAAAIHAMSGRKGEFVAVNCASIPGEILESELFGHEKGSFTGAYKQKIGKAEQADGGTLFLDEIGDMPLALQSKILRFLQEREIERVGGNGKIKVDVRVVCATHCDLKKMISEKNFREDLYFRISEYTLSIPPLRERDNDVIKIAESLLTSFRQDMPLQALNMATGFSVDAMAAMAAYSWPGNVRELQNKLKFALINCETALITPEDIELEYTEGAIIPPVSWLKGNDENVRDLDQIRKNAETKALFQAYREANQNITEAARILGITRHRFYSLISKYEMKGSLETEFLTEIE
jgi:putative PEP-CTERM system response regulator